MRWLRDWIDKRSEKRKWRYLGYTEVSYTYIDDNNRKSTCVIHFYARGSDLMERKVDYDQWTTERVKSHGWYQKVVVPWKNGANLYSAIQRPSIWLKNYTEEKHSYKFIDGKWVKPAPKVEREGENVLKFPENTA